jgi:hypothetical protein
MNVDELAEECGMWCTFLEYRYFDKEKGICTDNATDDERIAYDVYCFCGMIDADGMASLLSQPESKLQKLFESLSKLGLTALIKNVKEAADAVKKSGLSLEEKGDRSAVSQLLRPFQDEYYGRLRKRAYSRLRKFIHSSRVFNRYAANVLRCEQEGLNCYDPKVWTVNLNT